MHKYLPHTSIDIEDMLKTIGAKNIEHLFNNVPKSLQYQNQYQIPQALSDIELTKHMLELSKKNQELTIFRGYGAYDHEPLSIVKSLTSRQEFLTSYTPYQPEVSQGTLQYIFEYQSMICEITDMDVSNASMYDGPTATAEAMFMALAGKSSRKIILSQTLHPKIIDVLKTYGHYRHVDFVFLDEKNGETDFTKLDLLLENSAGIILQSPNKYGIIEDLSHVSDAVKKANSTFILNTDAQSLALLKTPGKLGADIACGDLQSLGIPLSFGGAYIGFLATKSSYLRKMPGRICGLTEDVDGKRSFVLTLQAREQHIRRAKANSNICSNQSLLALSVAIYLSSLGKQGFIDIAKLCLNASHYLQKKLLETPYFSHLYNKPFYKEFALKAHFDLDKFNDFLLEKDILGPVNLGDNIGLFAVTEKRSKSEIDTFIRLVGEFNEIL